MSDEIDAGLRGIFAELFAIDPAAIDDSSRRGELEGWDSVGHMQLVEALERWLRLRIDTRDALDIETFLDVRRLVARLLANRREGGGQDR